MKVAVIYNRGEADEGAVIARFGPQTKEHYNPKTVERVATALEKGGHNVRIIPGDINLADQLRDFMPRVLDNEKPGLVFNMAYGIQGQSRYTHIPAMLEMLGVPYVGSGPQAHAVALDKIMTKMVLQQRGLPTPDFWFFSSADVDVSDVKYPVIVKPKMEAVSMGLKIVDNPDDLRAAIREVIEMYQQDALVEAFISGREFAVGALGNGPDMEVLPIVEIDLGGDPNAIQTEDTKKKTPAQKLCPAPVTDEQAEIMRRLARDSFSALGICDFARIDLRMDADGNLYILELNSMASLGQTGSYLHAARTAGYSDQSLINRMLDVAAVRYFGASMPESDEQSKETQPLRIRVRSYLRARLDAMRSDLSTLVEHDTAAYHTEDVNQVGNWIAQRLAQIGFNRQLFPRSEVGNILYLTNHEEQKNDILILGYLDTEAPIYREMPFREERGRVYGHGVAGNKGGLVVLLSALRALRYTRRLKRSRVGVLLIPDETLNGRYSRDLVAEISAKSRHVVGLKGAPHDGGIITTSAGQLLNHLEIANPMGARHVKGADIASLLCQKVVALQKLASEEKGVRLTVDSLDARNTLGGTPHQGKASFTLSYDSQAEAEALEESFQKIARRGLDKFQVRVRKGTSRAALERTENNEAFYRLTSEIAGRLEIKISERHAPAPSSISAVTPGVPCLDGLGPIGGNVGMPTEYIFRDSIIDRAALLALLIYKTKES